MTQEHIVEACPECNSSQINERKTIEPKYKCTECGKEFDEPIERESKDNYARGMRYRCYHCDGHFFTTSEHHRIECNNCGRYVNRLRALYYDISDVEIIQKLSNGPIVTPKISDYTIRVRNIIERISIPEINEVDTVAYLPGDERRAMDLFVEVNLDYIERDINRKQQTKLVEKLSDDLYQLMLQQYYWNHK